MKTIKFQFFSQVIITFVITVGIFFNVDFLYAQNEKLSIKGVVKDNSKLTMPGVNITIKGTNDGTVTDVDGKYTLEVKKTDTLVFSFVGFEDQEIKVGENTEINLILNEGGKALEEVVITGFGEVKKRLYTGSSQSLSIDEVKQEGTADVSQMLQGRAAGVSVQSVSSTFGAGPKITIRGSSTINGDGKPLWVIDGVVQEDIINISADELVSGDPATLISSSVAGLNPSDILSFEILKDASATAIYGSRSLNGVIVITTKKGKKNQPLSINYSAEFVTREIPGYGDKNLMDSKENMELLLELEKKGRLDPTTLTQSRNSGVFGIMARRIDNVDPNTGEFLLKNTDEDKTNFLRQYEQANTDWFKVLFRNSVSQSHTISLSGGGEKTSAYASLGYYNDPGWSIADKVERYTVNIKNTYSLFRNISLGFSLLGSYRSQRAPGSEKRVQSSYYGTVSRSFDINPYSYALSTSRLLRPYDANGNREYYTKDYAPFNILHELEQNYLDITVQDIKFQVNLDVPIYKDKIKYNFVSSIRYVKSESDLHRTELSNLANAYRAKDTAIIERGNTLLYNPDLGNSQSTREVTIPYGGIYSNDDNLMENFYIRNAFTYSDKFGTGRDLNIHEIDIFAGQEIRYVDRSSVDYIAYGIDYNKGYLPRTDVNIFNKIIGQEDSNYFNLSNSRVRAVSFFSRITYGYVGKYFLSLTANLNASNGQIKEDGTPRWTPTWTVSGKWNILEEDFIPNNDILSELTTRIAYGLTATAGNATNTKAIYRYERTFRASLDTREPAVALAALQNLDLTWEKQYELNFGIDIGLLKNRINVTFDAYRRNGFDLFDSVTLPGVGGDAVKYINNADMQTNGFEVSIRTVNYKITDFSWSTTLNISYFDQVVTNLKEKPSAIDLVKDTGGNYIGFPRNSLFSYQFTGLNNVGLPTFILPDEDKTYSVDFAETGKNIPNGLLSYLKYEGPVEANQSYGLQNSFKYKNWSLGVFISASFGNKIRLPQLRFGREADNVSKTLQNRWILAGDEKTTTIPTIPDYRLNSTNSTGLRRAYSAYNYSDANIADGGFIRLKSISVRYILPRSITKKLTLSNITLNLQLQNLMLLYADEKLNGVDPEFYNTGGVATPINRQYTLSLNVRF